MTTTRTAPRAADPSKLRGSAPRRGRPASQAGRHSGPRSRSRSNRWLGPASALAVAFGLAATAGVLWIVSQPVPAPATAQAPRPFAAGRVTHGPGEQPASAVTALAHSTAATALAQGNATTAPAPDAAATAQPHGGPADVATYREARGQSGESQLHGAQVGEADLGLRLYPGATVDAAATLRVRDPSAGLTVSTQLRTPDRLDRVADFYRQELADRAGANTNIQELANSAGQRQWRALDRSTGVNRTVVLVQTGAEVRITLSLWRPPGGQPTGRH